MGKGFSNHNRTPRRDGKTEPETAAGPDVHFDAGTRTIRVSDARLINASQRAFCRRLLEAAARVGPASGRPRSISSLHHAGSSLRLRRPARSRWPTSSPSACRKRPLGSRGASSRFDRKAYTWIKLTAYPLANDVSLWETMDTKSDRVKLRHLLPDEDGRQLPLMCEAISGLEGVEACAANRRSRCLTVNFQHAKHELNGFVDQAERRFEELLAEDTKLAAIHSRGGSNEASTSIAEVATGPRRLLYLALAGGAFTMTLVGLIVPGIPTVPFLLATSYFLARSSRWLDKKLRESVYFGPIVTEWEQHGASRAPVKSETDGGHGCDRRARDHFQSTLAVGDHHSAGDLVVERLRCVSTACARRSSAREHGQDRSGPGAAGTMSLRRRSSPEKSQ